MVKTFIRRGPATTPRSLNKLTAQLETAHMLSCALCLLYEGAKQRDIISEGYFANALSAAIEQLSEILHDVCQSAGVEREEAA
jgi:hypothetical protein